GDHH
ncbi:unnamed protein product, partial [Leptidea sinapis]